MLFLYRNNYDFVRLQRIKRKKIINQILIFLSGLLFGVAVGFILIH